MCIYEATATRAGKKPRYLKPTPQRWSLYNQSCCHAFSGCILSFNTFVEGILRAAESSLEKMPNGKRKNYITRNTWNQIEKRNELRSNGAPSQEVHRLNKEISKQARLETISLKSSMKTQMTQTKKVSGGQSKI